METHTYEVIPEFIRVADELISLVKKVNVLKTELLKHGGNGTVNLGEDFIRLYFNLTIKLAQQSKIPEIINIYDNPELLIKFLKQDFTEKTEIAEQTKPTDQCDPDTYFTINERLRILHLKTNKFWNAINYLNLIKLDEANVNPAKVIVAISRRITNVNDKRPPSHQAKFIKRTVKTKYENGSQNFVKAYKEKDYQAWIDAFIVLICFTDKRYIHREELNNNPEKIELLGKFNKGENVQIPNENVKRVYPKQQQTKLPIS